jgi:Ca-activated chloride channel homolog
VIRFADPVVLWLLAALPLLPLARGRSVRAAALLFPSADLVRSVGGRPRPLGGWLGALRMLALGLAVVALARPQQGLGAAEVEASGIDIVLAIDISGSMRALDFELEGKRANRLEAVKAVVRKFIEARPDDRLGMVVFAGRPYLASPLTLDHDWLTKTLERAQIGMVEDGTAVGSAIAASTNRLRDRKAKSRVIILLTDGMNNAGKISPLTAAEAARALGVRIYTIGAGTEGQAPMPVARRGGREQIAMVAVDIDEKTLKQVADLTGGGYFRATDTSSLESIYEKIDRLEKTTEQMTKFERYRELFLWPLLAGLALLGLELVMAETRLRRLP